MLLRVGSAEVGGLIEVVECVPNRDLAWTSVTGIDQRGRWRLRERPREAARTGRAAAVRTASPAPACSAGWPSGSPRPPCAATCARTLQQLKRQVEHEGSGAAQPNAAAPGWDEQLHPRIAGRCRRRPRRLPGRDADADRPAGHRAGGLHLAPAAGGHRRPRLLRHFHRTQEEVLYVISGRLQAKFDDDVVELGPGQAVRIAPECVRSIHNDGPDDAEIVLVSVRVDDVRADVDTVPDFWPE